MSTLKTNKVQSVTTSDLTLDTGTTSKRVIIPQTTGDDVDLDALSGCLVIGNVAGRHIAIDDNEIQCKNDPTTAHELLLMADGGEVQVFGSTAGKMGIGTSSPKNTVQISHAGADGNNGLLIVRKDASTSDADLLGGVGFDSTDGNVPSSVTEASAFIAAYAAEDHATTDKGADLVFGTSAIDDNDDTASHERMRITDAGNVGIGTNDPKVPLDILEMGGLTLGYTALNNNDGATNARIEVGTSFAVPNANWKVTFVAPKSGKVEIQLSVYARSTSTDYLYLGLSQNSTYNNATETNAPAPGSTHENLVWEPDEDDDAVITPSWLLTGLSAGEAYTYYIGAKGANGFSASGLALDYGGTNSLYRQHAIIRAVSVPNTIHTD